MSHSVAAERILVVMAMEGEAQPVRERLGMSGRMVAPHPRLPIRMATGPFVAGCAVAVAINGVDPASGLDAIATQPAVLTTFVAASVFHPTLIISAGTAGGFADRGASIGDVIISEGSVSYHDRRIPIPGWDAYGVGSFPVAAPPVDPGTIGARFGTVTTGNSLDAPPIDRERMTALGTDAKDMEAAAVAEVAQRLSTPFLAVKGITDLVDDPEPTAEQFDRNLTATAHNVAQIVGALVAAYGSTQ